MKGNRNQKVWAKARPFLIEGRRQKMTQRTIQTYCPLVFKAAYGLAQGFLVDPYRFYPDKGRFFPKAGFAQMVCSFFRGVGKGAARAAGRTKRLDSGHAFGAENIQGRGLQLHAAKRTGGREKKVQKAGKFAMQRLQKRHSKKC